MKPGKVEKYINKKIEEEGAILLSLIDPDKQPGNVGEKTAKVSEESGADIILVGGSIGAQGIYLDETVKVIKEAVSIPVVLFPGNNSSLSPFADACYFMFLLNSKDVYWSTTAQIQGAWVVKKMGLEPIPTGYVVIEPGMAVGWVSNANLVPRSRPDLAAATALAAEYMGARLVITDSGSGAPSPAPLQLIKTVKSVLSIPYFYAGGIKRPEQGYNIIKAGADGIHVGTAFEISESKKAGEKIKAMSNAVKKAGKEKVG